MRPRETTVFDQSTGAIHIKKTMDAEPIMEAMRGYGDIIDKYGSRKLPQKFVGSIDPLTAQTWSQEWGLRIGSKEFAKKAVARLKYDINYRRFRVGG